MELFPSINAVYNTFFGPSPPTRACVACPLPPNCYVKMDVLAYRAQATSERSALHVRGLSYWAPANIGPYSQAVRVGERLFVAGQIGLAPATLTLPQPESLALEAALSSQHARRIVKAVQEGTGGGFSTSVESCICWLSGPSTSFDRKVEAARQSWKSWQSSSPSRISEQVHVLFAQVSSLPKGAQIEWQMVWSAPNYQDNDNDDDDPARSPSVGPRDGEMGSLARSSIALGPNVTTIVALTDVALEVGEKPRWPRADEHYFSIRVFHTAELSAQIGAYPSKQPFLEVESAYLYSSLHTGQRDSWRRHVRHFGSSSEFGDYGYRQNQAGMRINGLHTSMIV